MTHFARAAVIAICAALCAPQVATAQAPAQASPEPASEDQAYQQAIGQAVQEFSAGRWEEARALFKRAHQIEPNARTLRGMGMAAFELRMYVAALRELEAALRDARKPLTDEQRAQAQGFIDQSNAFVGRYQLILEPEGARPYVDGQPVQFEPGGILLFDVGEHELRVTADGYRPFTQQLRVDGGQNLVLRVTLEQETVAPPLPAAAPPVQPAPSGAPKATDEGGALGTVAWITLAGAGAFGAAAGIFWVVGEGQYDDLRGTCRPNCTDAQISGSGVETSDLMTNVFVGLAVAAGATSAVLFVLDADGSSGTEADTARVSVGPGSLVVSGSF